MRKIWLAALMALILICLAVSAILLIGPQLSIVQFVGNNPEKANKIANSLLDYRLPTGYLEQGGRDVGFVKMALIGPDGKNPQFQDNNVILLTTIPSVLGLSEDQYRQELLLAKLSQPYRHLL